MFTFSQSIKPSTEQKLCGHFSLSLCFCVLRHIIWLSLHSCFFFLWFECSWDEYCFRHLCFPVRLQWGIMHRKNIIALNFIIASDQINFFSVSIHSCQERLHAVGTGVGAHFSKSFLTFSQIFWWIIPKESKTFLFIYLFFNQTGFLEHSS